MRTKLRGRLSLLFMSFALMLALPAMAFADTLQINNDLVVGSNVAKDAGQSGTGKVWLVVDDNKTDPENGCNATTNNPVTVTFTSSDPSKIAAPASVQLTGCDTGAAQSFSYSVASGATAGTVQIGGTATGGKSGGTFTNTDTLTVTINAPSKQNTSVSNVSGSGTYGGNATLTAKLASGSNNLLSGKNVAFELNGVNVGTDATDSNGVAELSGVSLSGINAGNYSASATPPPVNASFTGDSGYNGSSNSGNLSVAKASSTTTVTCTGAPFTYTGSAQTPCTAKATGAGGLDQSLTVGYQNNTNAGQATASASFAGGDNHLGSNGSANFTIGKADATINVDGYTGTYDGNAHGATGTATGVGGSNLNSQLDLGESFTNFPGGTANWSFSGGTNYKDDSGSVEISISKATTTTTVSCGAGPFTYNGLEQKPCTAKVTGAGGLNQTLAVDYSNNVNAGEATASASYAASANHLGSSDSKNFQIAQKGLTVTAEDKQSTYGDNLPANSVRYDGFVNGENAANLGGTLAYSYSQNGNAVANPQNAGSYAITPSGLTSGNYSISFENGTLTINRAPGSVSINNIPTDAVFGGSFTPNYTKSGDGAASVSSLTEAKCTVSNAGVVNFVGAGTCTLQAAVAQGTNHLAASGSQQSFEIDKAATTTTVKCPASVTYNGSEHEPCEASATGPGLNQTLAVGYQNNVNAGQATASASYAGSANYKPSTGSANFTIAKANQTITFGALSGKVIGATFQVNATASSGLPVSFAASGSCTVSGNTVSVTGVGPCTITASQAGDSNYFAAPNVAQSFNATYNFLGFASPVDNNNVLNSVKAGQAIPLKWRLTDANGDPVTNLSSVKVTATNYSCGLSTTIDQLEEVAAGASGLQNLGNGYYQFNWKSPSTYANSCKTLNLDIGDGPARTALFKFTK